MLLATAPPLPEPPPVPPLPEPPPVTPLSCQPLEPLMLPPIPWAEADIVCCVENLTEKNVY